jgi:flagellar basal-body rod protein FlgB
VDIDFDKALSRALDGSSDRLTAKRTQIGHMASHAEPGAPVAREVQGLPVRNDGNNVSLEREMMALRSIRGKYKVAATVARKRFGQIKSALSEGR